MYVWLIIVECQPSFISFIYYASAGQCFHCLFFYSTPFRILGKHIFYTCICIFYSGSSLFASVVIIFHSSPSKWLLYARKIGNRMYGTSNAYDDLSKKLAQRYQPRTLYANNTFTHINEQMKYMYLENIGTNCMTLIKTGSHLFNNFIVTFPYTLTCHVVQAATIERTVASIEFGYVMGKIYIMCFFFVKTILIPYNYYDVDTAKHTTFPS